MERILDEIRKERQRQDDQHGGHDHDDIHYPGDWCLILTKYLGHAAAETIDGSDQTVFRDAMIKLAAVAVAATESFDYIGDDTTHWESDSLPRMAAAHASEQAERADLVVLTRPGLTMPMNREAFR